MALQSVDEGQACSFTGHRPARLRMACGSDAVRALTECLYRHTLYLYYESGIRHFFSGMAAAFFPQVKGPWLVQRTPGTASGSFPSKASMITFPVFFS